MPDLVEDVEDAGESAVAVVVTVEAGEAGEVTGPQALVREAGEETGPPVVAGEEAVEAPLDLLLVLAPVLEAGVEDLVSTLPLRTPTPSHPSTRLSDAAL
jgi:hypothetical protein